jgi:hypothetical protein
VTISEVDWRFFSPFSSPLCLAFFSDRIPPDNFSISKCEMCVDRRVLAGAKVGALYEAQEWMQECTGMHSEGISIRAWETSSFLSDGPHKKQKMPSERNHLCRPPHSQDISDGARYLRTISQPPQAQRRLRSRRSHRVVLQGVRHPPLTSTCLLYSDRSVGAVPPWFTQR